MDIDKNELMYVMLEDIYHKEIDKDNLPIGWYSYSVDKRIEILKEAIDNNMKVIDTKSYNDVMEKVILSDEKSKR